MNIKIAPVEIPLFGVVDTISVHMSGDNLADSASFEFSLGTIAQPPPRPSIVDGRVTQITPPPQFVASPISGNFTISGANYLAWSGDNETVIAYLETLLPTLRFLPA